METYIIKRDGKKELFTIDKIKNAISKAFLAVGAFATEETLGAILSHLRVRNEQTVEEIQNQVEVALMAEGYYQVAKAFILYRQGHTEDRETQQRLDFMMNYVQASNAAEGSKFDANANVEHKNIATLIGELPKQGFIRLNRHQNDVRQGVERPLYEPAQPALHLQERRDELSKLLRVHHDVSVAHRRYEEYRR